MKYQSRLQLQSGNVLIVVGFLILVIGLAAFLFIQNKHAGNVREEKKISLEQSKALAEQLINYGIDMRLAVQKFENTGYNINQISFAHPTLSPEYGKANSDPKSEIFNKEGGNMILRIPSAELLSESVNDTPATFEFFGNNAIEKIGTDCASPDCTELLMVLQNIRPEICSVVNSLMGIIRDERQKIPVYDQFDTKVPYHYSFSYAGTIGNSLAGNPTGCFVTDEKDGVAVFYQVIKAR
jgi:hypothetical protein